MFWVGWAKKKNTIQCAFLFPHKNYNIYFTFLFLIFLINIVHWLLIYLSHKHKLKHNKIIKEHVLRIMKETKFINNGRRISNIFVTHKKSKNNKWILFVKKTNKRTLNICRRNKYSHLIFVHFQQIEDKKLCTLFGFFVECGELISL